MNRPALRVLWCCLVGLAGLMTACTPVLAPADWQGTTAADARALSAPEVYRRAAPANAYVDTELSTGSGALVAVDGVLYVLTNAHVVWPLRSVRLTFPDGSELLDVPVFDLDLMHDLALLGPVDVDLSPLAWGDGEALPIGSDVYLIGYPNEDEFFPQPTLGRGILGRIREWELGELTLLQSDATIVGGQSGGVMVDDTAHIVGITTWSDGDGSGSYAVATSARDLLPRIQAMAAGEDADQLGDRVFPLEGVRKRAVLVLPHYWHAEGVMVNGLADTLVTVTATTPSEVTLVLMDTAGYELAFATSAGVTTVLSATAEYDEPLVLVATPAGDGPATVRLESTSQFARIPDPDDGKTMAVGDLIAGNLDYPRDLDTYTVELEAAAPVVILVESVRVDPIVFAGAVDASDEEYVQDDDSGRGPFGTDASLWFEAPEDGLYRIVVADSFGTAVGGYLLSIEPAEEAGEP